MRISTKGIYALEVAVDLSMNSSEKNPESVKNIAMRRELSEKYLERIIGLLKRAGIVTSIRGARGGYFLSEDPQKITVGQVLEAAEGSLAPVECLVSKTECKSDCDACVTRKVWAGMWEQINGVTGQLSIADLVKQIKK